MTYIDFIPTTADAPYVENTPLAENANSSVKNFGVEPTINENDEAPLVNEQEGFE
jgi:hypothetical protein